LKAGPVLLKGANCLQSLRCGVDFDLLV